MGDLGIVEEIGRWCAGVMQGNAVRKCYPLPSIAASSLWMAIKI